MLVASENFYFEESSSGAANRKPKDTKIPVLSVLGNPLKAYAGK